ncbi:transposase family protein [Cysteiniphilum sp. QT6929]|uniref:transposase family protein n=1 Tax=Cysteiniphilum sp. QT6929 TaxID=2975055 RepID=UPI0024B360BF|nr:transposase family protein [Cysteiniphilum sp. QT6929]WHN65247.1 transposase family protein [Cysteiniphilum sp. QT6929]
MTENTVTSSIFTHFESVKDPRVNRCKKHKLIDILFMTLSAVICGADNWVAIEAFCKAKKDWLTDMLKLKYSTPKCQYSFLKILIPIHVMQPAMFFAPDF